MIDVTKIKTPIIREAYEYWMAKSAGTRLPSRSDIRPKEISHLLPYVVLIDVGRNPPHFAFRLVGTTVTGWARKEYTGFVLHDGTGDPWQRVFDDFNAVVQTRQPHHDEREAAWVGADYRRFERILAPMSEDGVNISMLFGALHVLLLTTEDT